ncbi:MAG: hypothetical protein Q9195_007742 [Heterodermia aff. obscurata]
MGVKSWDIDIDRWLNPLVPYNRLSRLPRPISRFLGYRNGPHGEVGNILVAWWAFVGAFSGVAVLEAALMIPEIQKHGVPTVIASFGAAAILEYNVISSPLAQPRNSLFGHILSASVGIGVTKLFMLNSDFEDLRWLAGATSCGLASAVMTLTKTVYPPAGATALLAAVDPTLSRLGWYLLPLVLLSAALTLVTSLLLNNIQRQYPVYWWTAADLNKKVFEPEIKKVVPGTRYSVGSGSTQLENDAGLSITVLADAILVPESILISQEEIATLEVLRIRLKETASSKADRKSNAASV